MQTNKPVRITSFALLALFVIAAGVFAVSRRPAREREKLASIRETVMNNTNRGDKPVTIRDYPNNGVVIRHMADPANVAEAEYIFQAPPELRAATNQYSFVIENTSAPPIILLSLTYAFPKAGGGEPQFSAIRSNAVQARIQGATGNVLLRTGEKVGICLALGGQENLNFKSGLHYIQPNQPIHPMMNAEQLKQHNQAVISQFGALDRLLSGSTGMVIEIEGVAFDDSTFVGTNRRHSFEQANAMLEGAREFTKELTDRAAKGASHANLVAYVQPYARQKFEDLLKPFGGDIVKAGDAPAFQKQLMKQFVAMRFQMLREEGAMNYIRYGAENWRPLRKKE